MAYSAYTATQTDSIGPHPLDRLLAAAIRGDHVAVRQCLRQPDVPVDLPLSDWGSTPLQCAVEKGDAQVCRLLLARRADFTVQDAFGDTCLHRAAHHGFDEVALVLLEGGALVDLKNDFGQTALHVAAMKGHSKIIELLLLWGAELVVEDVNGQTALAHATQQRRTEAAALLDELQKQQESLLPHELQPLAKEVLSSYFNVLHEGRKRVHRLRLMVIGASGSGKSYLREALLGIPLSDSPEYIETGFFQDGKVYYLDRKQYSPWIDNSCDSQSAAATVKNQYNCEVARLLLRQVLHSSVRYVSNSHTAVKEMIQRAIGQLRGLNSKVFADALSSCDRGAQPTVKSTVVKPLRSRSTRTKMKCMRTEKIMEEIEVDETAVRKAVKVIPGPVLRQLGLLWRRVLEKGTDMLLEERPKLEVYVTEVGGSPHLWRLVAPILPHQALYLATYNPAMEDGQGTDAKSLARTISLQNSSLATQTPLQYVQGEQAHTICCQLLTVASLLPQVYFSHVAKADQTQPFPSSILCGTHRDCAEFGGYSLSNLMHMITSGNVLNQMLATQGYSSVNSTQRETTIDDDTVDNAVCFLRREVEITGRNAAAYDGGSSHIPLGWFNFEDQLHSLRKSGVHYMDMARTLEESREVSKLRDHHELSSMLSYFHSMGWVCYLAHIEKVNDIVVCDVDWLINCLNALVSVQPSAVDEASEGSEAHSAALCLQDSGVLQDELLVYVWSEESASDRELLIRYLEGMDLLACLGSTRYLPVAVKSSLKSWESYQEEFDSPAPLHIVFPNELLIIGLFDRLVVHALRKWSPDDVLLSCRGAQLQIRGQWFMALQEQQNCISVALFKAATPPLAARSNRLKGKDQPSLDVENDDEGDVLLSSRAICKAVRGFLDECLDTLRDRWFPGMIVHFCISRRDVVTAGPMVTVAEQLGTSGMFVDLSDLTKETTSVRISCWLA